MSATKVPASSGALAARAIHLKITPAPRDVRQSREILKLLKGFGDVTMFQNLKYDKTNRAKDAILAVFRTPESASEVLRASPIRFSLAPEKPYNPVSIASAGLDELFGKQTTPTQSPAHTEEGEGEEVEFEMLVKKSFLDYKALVQRQRLYWGFIPEKSFVNDALKPDVPLPGLANMPPAHDPVQKARIVQRNLEAVAARKTLRQMRAEAFSHVDHPGEQFGTQ